MLKHPDYRRRQKSKLCTAPVTRICALCGTVVTMKEKSDGGAWKRHIRKCQKRARKHSA